MENQPAPLVGLLENVRSLWNVGSIFRSADGAGVGRLLLCGFTGHPPRAEITKTALGAEEAVDWEYWASPVEAARALREQGYRLLALEQAPGAVALSAVELEGPTAFVVGHEITGVSEELLAECDGAFAIPMAGVKESLNVAVAFGIAAYGLRAALPGELRPADPGLREAPAYTTVRRRREISRR